MYLVNLKREYESEIMGGTQLVIASVMSMIKDLTAEDEERTEMCFDDDGNLFIPDGIIITEDTKFLLDIAADTATILSKSPEEADSEGCECTCRSKSTNLYYAVVYKPESSSEDGADVEYFEVESLIMRDDPVTPQYIIGFSREGKYVIPIEREQFENLEIGDQVAVYMGEYYGTEVIEEDAASEEEESAWNDEEE